MYKLKNSIAYDDDKYALEPQINDTSIVFSNSIDIYDGTEQFALEMCTCRCLQMFIATFFLKKESISSLRNPSLGATRSVVSWDTE